MPILTNRFEEALRWSTRHHAKQQRKGTEIPYVAHLLQVAGLVLEAGGDEETTIAALLHDAIEDAEPGEAARVREEIRKLFGERVLSIVEGCTDADTQPKPPWHERKRAYLDRLGGEGPDVRLVSCADKLHNARAILRDYRALGEPLWDRFNAGREDTLWYYDSLVDAYRAAGGPPLLPELEETVAQLKDEISARANAT